MWHCDPVVRGKLRETVGGVSGLLLDELSCEPEWYIEPRSCLELHRSVWVVIVNDINAYKTHEKKSAIEMLVACSLASLTQCSCFSMHLLQILHNKD